MFKKEINTLRAAIAFLTLLPLAGKKDQAFDEESFVGSIRYFTFVGFIYGFLNLILLFLFRNFFFEHVFLFGLLFLAASIFLSGGLHLDGLMDSFDGIAASKSSREETLKVMKDSRVGAFGAMAAALLILAKFVFLIEIAYSKNFLLIAFLLFLMPMLSRWMMVLIICFQVKYSEIKEEGNSLMLFKRDDNWFWLVLINTIAAKIFAWIIVLVFKIPFNDLLFCDLLIVSWIISSWFIYAWLKFKLKGHSGDSMGAGLELSEALYLLVICIAFMIK